MKVICDCGATVSDQVQMPVGQQPDGKTTIETSIGFYVSIWLSSTKPSRVLDMVCNACGRTFIRVDVLE